MQAVITKPATAEPLKYQQKIGSTVYNVTVNFSRTSRETIEDKLLRLIENEARIIALTLSERRIYDY